MKGRAASYQNIPFRLCMCAGNKLLCRLSRLAVVGVCLVGVDGALTDAVPEEQYKGVEQRDVAEDHDFGAQQGWTPGSDGNCWVTFALVSSLFLVQLSCVVHVHPGGVWQ